MFNNYILMSEVYPNIYLIKVPLPIKALGEANVYVILDNDDFWMVDAGIWLREAIENIEMQIRQLGFDISRLKGIIVTHLHIDHIGGSYYFRRKSKAEVYIHEMEYERISYIQNNMDKMIADIMKLYLENGVPRGLIEEIYAFHPGYKSIGIYRELKIDAVLKDKDILQIGDFNFNIVWTPGHTMGHICLYEENNRIILTGDHILPEITPNITLVHRDLNPLKDYLDSLSRIEKLNPRLMLPGHGPITSNVLKRVIELKNHHANRLDEILDIIKIKPSTAYEIAKKIRWDVPYKQWDDYPIDQKYFAIGEALSHIKFLLEEKLISSNYINGKLVYRAT